MKQKRKYVLTGKIFDRHDNKRICEGEYFAYSEAQALYFFNKEFKAYRKSKDGRLYSLLRDVDVKVGPLASECLGQMTLFDNAI